MSKRNKNLKLEDKLDFGKYEGYTVKELIKKDPDYLAWACDNIDWFNLDQEAEWTLDYELFKDD